MADRALAGTSERFNARLVQSVDGSFLHGKSLNLPFFSPEVLERHAMTLAGRRCSGLE